MYIWFISTLYQNENSSGLAFYFCFQTNITEVKKKMSEPLRTPFEGLLYPFIAKWFCDNGGSNAPHKYKWKSSKEQKQ